MLLVAALSWAGFAISDDACGPDVRPPITIASDFEFTAANGVQGGSGTADDPYIIEGGRIDAGYAEYGIRIERTTRHFVIRDVHISGASKAAIFLSYVHNAVVERCRIVGNWIGITLNFTSGVTLRDCTLASNTDGVHMYFSRGTTLTDCTLERNETAAWLDASHENRITDCVIADNHMGVYLDLGSEGNLIFGNTFLANVHNAHSTADNDWDCDGVGNYWYDYVGVDGDADGIGDSPYVIRSQGEQDNFPLVTMP
jgi:parallel beta-helix repeat protein